MDPISIITGAASLAGVVLTASLKIKDVIDQLDNAPQNVGDIADEIYAVQYALSQVEDVVRRDPNVVDRLALEDVFALAVKGCHATLLSIHKEYEQLFARSDWKAKFLVLWKDGEMTRLLGRLDRKKATLTLLTQTLNLRSTQDIKDLLVQNQATLVAAEQDMKTPTWYRTGPARAVVSDPFDDDENPYADNESILSSTEFDFDHDLINTRTYRRALARAQSGSKTPKAKEFDVDKPLPELTGGRSPVSSSPVQEDDAGDNTDSINLSGETLTPQPSLSRATTLLPPDAEGLESGTVSVIASPPDAGKWVQPQLQIDGLRQRVEVKSAPPTAAAASSLVPAEEEKDKSQEQISKRRPSKHASRRATTDGEEKPSRRRAHGGPPLLKQLSACSSMDGSSQSLSYDGVKTQMMEHLTGDIPADFDNMRDKLRHRHRCGRRPDPRHRGRGSKSKDVGGEDTTEEMSQTPSPHIQTVEDAVRQLSLSGPASLRRELRRRRFAA